MTISLVNVAKYYQGLPNQERALQILQKELERTNPELLSPNSEFMQIWKNPEPGVTIASAATAVAATAATVGAAAAMTGNPAVAVVAGATAVAASATAAIALPQKVELPVPYFSQLNNEQNPHGSCNVTSVAMCLVYLGYKLASNRREQLEDELYRYCLNNGLSRHSPTDLAKLIQIYGYKDDFQPDAKWGDVKKWLNAGKPCIVHGWFSRSGHIIVITGYNEKGWIVNDPYGEWYDWGYDTSVTGKGLTYSYGMMERICGTDGDLWIHYVSK